MTPQGIEAGTGETERLDTKCESPDPVGVAPDKPDARDWQNRAERAEAECNELRAEVGIWQRLANRAWKRESVKGESNGQ